ncbi:hypothetical protein AHF37_12601 [Paragonimus kellicotti]|nr:hypothetical protein AHF37_12601 [Paragonimus kellicotti]
MILDVFRPYWIIRRRSRSTVGRSECSLFEGTFSNPLLPDTEDSSAATIKIVLLYAHRIVPHYLNTPTRSVGRHIIL